MKISDEQLNLIKLYADAPLREKIKIYARIIFNFNDIKRHLDKYIPESGAVLDYGCGYGIFANYIKLKNPNLNVIGFDISKTRINEAKKSAKTTGVKFVEKPNEVELDNLNLVLLIDVLLFLPIEEKIKLLKKLYIAIEDNGIVFIKDTLKSDSLRFKYTKFEEKVKLKFGIYGKEVKSGLHYIGVDEFKGILTNFGFKIVEIAHSNLIVYPGVFIVARK